MNIEHSNSESVNGLLSTPATNPAPEKLASEASEAMMDADTEVLADPLSLSASGESSFGELTKCSGQCISATPEASDGNSSLEDVLIDSLGTSPIVQAPCVRLTVGDVFASLHRRGQLLPLLRGVAVEAAIERAAQAVGLTVTEHELQLAFDRYRQLSGLRTREETLIWLAAERFTFEMVERRFELELLTEKFGDHLLLKHGRDFFQRQVVSFSKVKLRRMVLPSLHQAREILLQVSEDGSSFSELATRCSLDMLDRQTGGDLGIVLRRQLTVAAGNAVFSVLPGALAGPVHCAEGFIIYLVEEFLPAEFDTITQGLIRDDLFTNFVNEQLSQIVISEYVVPVAANVPDVHAQPGTLAATSDL